MITGNRDCLALYATYRDDASNKTLEEIGAHACDVANIVTHVVSDCGRVAWVVLRDILLNFTDEICADDVLGFFSYSVQIIIVCSIDYFTYLSH